MTNMDFGFRVASIFDSKSIACDSCMSSPIHTKSKYKLLFEINNTFNFNILQSAVKQIHSVVNFKLIDTLKFIII